MTLDQFTDEVCERLRADMQSIRNPDGDIHPAVFTFFGGAIIRKKIPFEFFDNYESKTSLARVIGGTAAVTRPRFLAFETTAYMITLEKGEERPTGPNGEFIPAHEIPGNEECVTLVSFSRSEFRYRRCLIERDGRNPPVYSEWGDYSEATDIQGAVYEPLRKGMQG